MDRTAPVDAALRYLESRQALDRPVSVLFQDPRHGLAMRQLAAIRAARWHHYRETGRTGFGRRVLAWWRSRF